jgi:hypothetical protein
VGRNAGRGCARGRRRDVREGHGCGEGHEKRDAPSTRSNTGHAC